MRRHVGLLLLAALGACDSPSEPKPVNPADVLVPTISITSPERGAMLVSGTYEPSPITVTGEACHESQPITSLAVNGASMTVSGTQLCEPFSVTMSSPWGMSAFTVVARNKLGRETTHAQAFLRSPRYYPPLLTADVGGRILDATLVRVSQAGMTKLTSSMVGIPPFAMGASIPNPIANTEPTQPICDIMRPVTRTGYRVVHGSVLGSPAFVNVSVDQTSETLTWRGEFVATMPVTVTGYSKSSCEPVIAAASTGSATTRLSADVNTRFGIDVLLRGVEVEGQINTSALVDRSLNVDFSGMPFLTDDDRRAITALTYASMDPLLPEIGPIVLQQYGFEFAKVPLNVTLPAERLDALGLGLWRAGEAFDFQNNGMLIVIGAQSYPKTPRGGAAPTQGSIRTAQAAWPPSEISDDVGYGMNDDFLNQILWSAWQGGLFDAAALTGTSGAIPGMTLSMRSLLPPVLSKPTPGSVRISWGDAQISAAIDPRLFGAVGETSTMPVQTQAHATVILNAELHYDSLSAQLTLNDVTHSITVQVANVSTVSLNDNAVREAIRGVVEQTAPGLVRRVIGATPIAEAVLADFRGLPAGTKLPVWRSGMGRFSDYALVTGLIVSPPPAAGRSISP